MTETSTATELLQQQILDLLDKDGSIPDTTNIYHDQQTVQSILNSLLSREVVTYEMLEESSNALTEEGLSILQHGSHEARVFYALPAYGAEGPGCDAKQIASKIGEQSAKVGQGRAFKNKWIAKDADGSFKRNMSAIEDITQMALQEIQQAGKLSEQLGGEKEALDLRKRKLTCVVKTYHFTVKKGAQFTTKLVELRTDLTSDMLGSAGWKTENFKKYNFEALGRPTSGGALHPLLRVREEIRNNFFDMGFTEMPTNQFVESCFWNFDAMFVPQQHPARDVQDTFYIRDPAQSALPQKEYLDKVRMTHEVGGFGSIGYRAPFSEEETRRLVLRTHTTAVSTSQLAKLAQAEGGFKPTKLFSIDRVFRNETTDATHLAEFHQVEGVIADYDLTLGDLIGFMEVFFGKMGIKNLRFKPAYNPYTEPSLEIFSYHEGLKKWVEIGNSGVFRPEMLLPMGIPENVRALGFGLSLERPTMIKYGMNNIRDLVGHKCNIAWVEKQAAVRF